MKPSEFFVKKRNEIGISQSKLADLLGYSSQAISAWENERSYPDLSIWSKYASILKVDLASFIECKETKENDNCDSLVFDGDKFANNLKHLRKKSGLTQGQLAKKLDVNIKTISGWEQGTSYPSLNSFITLCSLFKLTYDQLYFVIDENNEPEHKGPNKKILIPIISVLAIATITGSTFGIISMNNRSHQGHSFNEESTSTTTSEETSSESTFESISSDQSSNNSSESYSENTSASSEESSEESTTSSEESSQNSLESSEESTTSNEESSQSSLESSEETIVDFEYKVNLDDSVTITGIPDGLIDIAIPSSIDGHEVSNVTKNAITDSEAYINQTIRRLSIPSTVSVDSFDQISFYRYPILEYIDIPKNTTEISVGQFAECHSLKEMTIPSQITFVPASLFQECTSLEKVNIKANLQSIEQSMFHGCKKLKEVNIPSSVTKIGTCAFYRCEALEQLILPDSLKTVEANSFLGCYSLKTITIPSKTTFIRENAFLLCTSIESIYIPKSVIFIGENAFQDCYNLTIYCEAETKPDTWSDDWNASGCNVVWGYNY